MAVARYGQQHTSIKQDEGQGYRGKECIPRDLDRDTGIGDGERASQICAGNEEDIRATVPLLVGLSNNG